MKLFTALFSVLVISGLFGQELTDQYTASINGTILRTELNPSSKVQSQNGKYWCTYSIKAVTDEMRLLKDFRFYEDDKFLFSLSDVPGSDVEISNSGKIIFYDHSEHFNGKLKLNIYSREGNFLFEKVFHSAVQFVFSPSGELLGVRTPEGIIVLSLESGQSYKIEKGLEYSFDETDETVAVAQDGKILLYKNSNLIGTIQTDINLPRKVAISSSENFVSVIDKYHLKVFSLSNHNLIFDDKIGGDFSFRDSKIVDDKIIAGIHKRNKEESTGLLRIYDMNGNIQNEKTGNSKLLKQFEKINLKGKTDSGYDPVPWPFFPFDSMRTVWNHYEQHMGLGGTSSYLHQGLDLITPIAEPTYSVIDGYVKCVLTLGGDIYWRIAISDTQIGGRSDGWLSAHLIESTIQFDEGDTVQIHDYLGDIVEWTFEWGHIHFVEISDSGLVWFYFDDEWGINFSPILALQPYPDVTPPYIDPVFSWSKFAFAYNNTATYLNPDSLLGQIDIIVKVVDYVGDSEWQQPAYTTWYTIKRISDGTIIKPRTLGHILNHKYPFYDGSHYEAYAEVMYQRDNTLPPSGWMETERNYYHNLTNSNGDSVVELSEKSLSFDTDDYPDGDYRIIVEVYDESGNFDIDSMDVKFKNGNPNETKNEQEKIYSFSLEQNYPNPFNPTTKIRYEIPLLGGDKRGGLVTLKVYDVLGNEITTLVNEEKPAGEYEVEFNGANLPSGVYFYQFKAGSYIETRKMVLVK